MAIPKMSFPIVTVLGLLGCNDDDGSSSDGQTGFGGAPDVALDGGHSVSTSQQSTATGDVVACTSCCCTVDGVVTCSQPQPSPSGTCSYYCPICPNETPPECVATPCS